MTGQDERVAQIMLPRGFAGRITHFFMNRGHKAIYKNVAEMLAFRSDDDLLEVACGNGYFLKKFAPQARSVTGLDLSELGIRLASKKHADRIAAATAGTTPRNMRSMVSGSGPRTKSALSWKGLASQTSP